MLMADPAVLSDLVDRYVSLRQALAAQDADRPTDGVTVASAPTDASNLSGAPDTSGTSNPSGSELRRRIDDVSYTLCVSTGTRDITAALAVARRWIDASGRPASGGTPPRHEVTLAS